MDHSHPKRHQNAYGINQKKKKLNILKTVNTNKLKINTINYSLQLQLRYQENFMTDIDREN